MSIILNEYEWAKKAIKERSLGKHPYETLSRVAKYYTYEKKNKKEVRLLLNTFLLQCEPDASLVKWSDTLDRAAKTAVKYPLIIIDQIPITKPEMERIDALDGRQLRRLAFTLLCIAKYTCLVCENTNNWVNTPDSEIMRMANVNTSVKRQSLLYSSLQDAGMIRFSRKVDSLSVQVRFVEDGEPVMHICDFRNLGYQYLKYHSEPYFECVNCGLVERIQHPEKNFSQKYCKDCAVKLHTKQKVNSVMRRRSNIAAQA